MAIQSVAFRVDASIEIGTGHVMRCLSLATQLRIAGFSCHFITRSDPGHLNEIISKEGHDLWSLSKSQIGSYGTHSNPPAHAAWLRGSWKEDALATREFLKHLDPSFVFLDHDLRP